MNRRITVDEVRAAMEKTGFKLCTVNIHPVPDFNKCCAMGQIANAADDNVLYKRENDSWEWDYIEDKYGYDYMRGFYRGFDNPNSKCYSDKPDRWKEEFADGRHDVTTIPNESIC